ncbi:hypothetical protein ACGFNU_05910 [Spirillospora sp. NPDC048911]|uniref:hypothetical protein n=1 Tax=Spirillospora sp. NPDC048911 TaxID=3364527 RepID=UPI00371C6016
MLYEWCETPKYRTLTGRVTGLSPAAISNLIGRNPLTRPPETASLRFVEACLRYRGHPDPQTELARWKAQWDALSEREANAAGSPAQGHPNAATSPSQPNTSNQRDPSAPSGHAGQPNVSKQPVQPGVSGQPDVPDQPGSPSHPDTQEKPGPPGRPDAAGPPAPDLPEQTQPSPLPVEVPDPTVETVPSFSQSTKAERRTTVPPMGLAVVAALVTLAAVAVVVVFVNRDDTSGTPSGSSTDTGAGPMGNTNDPSAEMCQPRTEIHTDKRQNKLWRNVFQCSNKAQSPLYEHPRSGTQVGVLDTQRSWFACWARGEKHAGGSDIWYYTQGDRMSNKAELKGWGFMPASWMLSAEHPNPGVKRECSFS